VNKQPLIKLGKYRHYKGGEYQVIDLATHSETEELMVVYRPLYGDKKLWVRPLEMFLESTHTSAGLVKRFTFVRE
jgi:hypothetical protein